ncbi:DNA glycosylase [Hypoxylon trugodes]|uniref:DNA glycosylase n=1 Tax=Hypoxylon trugodes TaxID=326681 RepID=UPI00218F3981|nr:DNA glycosylase [Hypoxylon trugodes]KAI1388166.1 DNA glycosylase [Hypoxylon trugodes]
MKHLIDEFSASGFRRLSNTINSLSSRPTLQAISSFKIHYTLDFARVMTMAAITGEANSIGESPTGLRRSARNASKKAVNVPVKQEEIPTKTLVVPARRGKKRSRSEEEVEDKKPDVKRLASVTKKSSSPPATTRIKAETEIPSLKKEANNKRDEKPKETKEEKEANLRARKLKTYAQFANKSPFPDFPRPTPQECQRAYSALASLHGERQRPEKISAPADRAGCGDSPSVLDALVRTILSQNTSNRNSTRAKLDMDEVYGSGDSEERWEAIATGGTAKLEKAIARGGLGGVKSRAIINILQQVKERHGTYSLDHLLRLEASGDDEEVMRELISFKGVGPKTASCVLLFCMGRDSFAVDTHVHRITGMLGWRPATASRDETFAHLDVKIPDELKYSLHVLFVEHGRKCAECKAGGKNLGKCELRKAFKRKDINGQGNGEGIEQIEDEDNDDDIKEEPDLKASRKY